MERPGVAPDDDRRAPEQRDELLDGARRSEQRPAVACRVHDRLRGIVLPGAPHDEHRRAGLRGEACAEGGEAVGGPALVSPPRAREKGDEPIAGLHARPHEERVSTRLGGGIPRQRELDRGGPDAERFEQREVLLDHVPRGRGRRHVPVRQERAPALTAEGGGEADPERGARRRRQEAALQEPLEVQGDVEPRRTQIPRKLAETAARAREVHGRQRAAPAARVHGHDRVEDRVAREQRRLAPLDDPAEARVGQPRAKRCRDRERVDNVAERRKLHERDVHLNRSTIREIKSRVE